jgi:chemotaxis signal transduction protein
MSATGYVLFRLGERGFASPLDDVREIVRLAGLERLPGTKPPLAGVIVLRGTPLPVLDVREQPDPDSGDVLVMTVDGEDVGVAVDSVTAVLGPDELSDAEPPGRTLPSYVVEVRKHRDAPVLLVDLHRMLDGVAA